MIGFSAWIFSFALGFYAICVFQWYNYKALRVLFHFAKPLWHLYFVLLPVGLFALCLSFAPKFALLFSFFYAGLIVFWQLKMAVKLVNTTRTTIYFFILAFVSLLCLMGLKKWYFLVPASVLSVVLSLIISSIVQGYMAKFYKKQAANKLEKMSDLKIILITASYGKTSIKNYLCELLEGRFKTQASPRSVNTLMGLVQDINENLDEKTKIYIAEAGARVRGDIKEIAQFLNPQIVLIGQIGTAHLEYFKSVEAIRATKLEALNSNRLEAVFAHSSTGLENGGKTRIYDENIKNIKADLEGLSFELRLLQEWQSIALPDLLGEFNAPNVAAAAMIAHTLGMDEAKILSLLKTLKNTEHRLSRMDNGGKIIIDDGFNGNFDGMSASYRLCDTYSGRKVLVTPGIMEGGKEANIRLSSVINEVFDVVIITSSLNAKELKSHLKRPEIIELKNKDELVGALAQFTKKGDLVLFSNDAPKYM